MTLSASAANRLGFIILGLTNNFAYVIMLSAAYDLLKQSDSHLQSVPANVNPQLNTVDSNVTNLSTTTPLVNMISAAEQQQQQQQQEKYCNEHSTSTILLADTLPSLATKIVYPILLVGLPTAHKAIATAFLTAIAFVITGLSVSQFLIFTGVVCASLSSGLGESTYLSRTPLYGDVSLSGWSMGTGAAGVLGAAAYALLRMILSIKVIMLLMLVVPVAMIVAYFFIIQPVDEDLAEIGGTSNSPSIGQANSSATPMSPDEEPIDTVGRPKKYGASDPFNSADNPARNQTASGVDDTFDLRAKIQYLPSLAKYFLPLLLVYFAEYFINQGLFELIYYPEVSFLNHAAQYRWFQVSYQVGVMISRSSLDIIRIKNLWTMSILQVLNALIFLAHASKITHIPSFYIIILLIIYEGLLGGFTYVNTFFRVKKEVKPDRREFAISTVTIADSLGIVFAALLALPTHDALCKLYA